MPSLIPGYEYDIFISYRHKDNLPSRGHIGEANNDGWVTEFVSNLRKELEATFKDDVSIYFDENPHDGLLETHDVEDSLNSKLKCLIFIPIVSQTYCDARSYAWTKEFLVFKNLAKEDQSGLKIKLVNGNVTSRILPVKINDLDDDDKKLLEGELGPLRAIDFIFRSPGVNRPLQRHEEEPKSNLNHTLYRDQINKVAHTVKDIITALRNRSYSTAAVESEGNTSPPIQPVISSAKRKKIAWISGIILLMAIAFWSFYFLGSQSRVESNNRKKYIAVLPFTNLNRDSAQDYFSDGITEDILNHLVKVSDLNVKSRTSSLQYKNSAKTIPQIASELDVGTIVEGTVRREGNKVRIVVQLIDVKNDIHLWSETYDREMKDVLSLQSEVAVQIATALHAKLSTSEKKNIENVEPINTTAYDYYLRARKIYKIDLVEKRDLDHALTLLQKAITLDPKFAAAYAAIGDIQYFYMPGINEKVSIDSSFALAEMAIQLDSRCADAYLLRGSVLRLNYNKFNEGLSDLKKAYQLAPNNPDVLDALGWLYLETGPKREGALMVLKAINLRYTIKDPDYFENLGLFYATAEEYEKAEKLYLQSKTLDPGTVSPRLIRLFQIVNKHSEAVKIAEEYWNYSPTSVGAIDALAWAHFEAKNLDKAEELWSKYKDIEKTFQDTTQRVSFRHRLAMVKWMKGDRKKATELFHEQLKIDSETQNRRRRLAAFGNQDYLYDLVAVNSFLGNKEIALQNIDSLTGFSFFPYLLAQRDPLMDNIRTEKKYKDWAESKRKERKERSEAMLQALAEHEASDQIKAILDK